MATTANYAERVSKKGITRFLSRRDKSKNRSDKIKGSHKQEDEPISGEASSGRQSVEVREEQLRELHARFREDGVYSMTDEQIRFALESEFAKGDSEKAAQLLDIFAKSEAGIVVPYDPTVKLLGAVNRQSKTCWLDSTLFAIFAQWSNFEPMLHEKYENEAKHRLSTLLRLWVNMVRAGKLVPVDITEQIQESLAECGWADAAKLEEQDAAEGFRFITNTLDMPMLKLEVSIFHGGADRGGDRRIEDERLLEITVPDENPDQAPIPLELCIENSMASRIEIHRQLERRTTLNSIHNATAPKASPVLIDAVEVNDSGPATPMGARPLSPVQSLPPYSPIRPDLRDLNSSYEPSFFSKDEKNEYGPTDAASVVSRRGRPRATTREFSIPAWQFYRLLPWHTDAQAPENDEQIAQHLHTAPVIGIALTRMKVENGRLIRQSTRVDVPVEFALPGFISDEDSNGNGQLSGNFKLSLQSAVCHRPSIDNPNSIDVGHYISIARGRLKDGRNTWFLFDDVAPSKGLERVREIDVEDALREEIPYLLFYQILPLSPSSENSQTDRPPSYESESHGSGTHPSLQSHISVASTNQNERPSFELTAPEDDTRRGRSSGSRERRQSLALTDSSMISLNTRDQPLTEGKDESACNTGAGVSRRGSKLIKGGRRSRPVSQHAEHRLSASFSRFTGKLASLSKTDVAFLDGTSPSEHRQSSDDVPAMANVVTAAIEEESKINDDKKHKDRKGNGRHKLKKSALPDRECNMM